jgi:hypothetical protein
MGGFIAQSASSTFFYVIVVLCGVSPALAIPLLRETYAPVIKLRRGMMTPDPEKAAAEHTALTMGRWA